MSAKRAAPELLQRIAEKNSPKSQEPTVLQVGQTQAMRLVELIQQRDSLNARIADAHLFLGLDMSHGYEINGEAGTITDRGSLSPDGQLLPPELT